jgi:hypothetical protein
MSSWPAFFAAALATWLVLKGPAANKPSWVQSACRVALVFFLYCGFLYLLKWNPFWKWMLSVDFENRNKVEGFLILISTLVWIIATLRILVLGFRFPALRVGLGGLERRVRRQENARRRLSLTDLALFYLFMRK